MPTTNYEIKLCNRGIAPRMTQTNAEQQKGLSNYEEEIQHACGLSSARRMYSFIVVGG